MWYTAVYACLHQTAVCSSSNCIQLSTVVIILVTGPPDCAEGCIAVMHILPRPSRLQGDRAFCKPSDHATNTNCTTKQTRFFVGFSKNRETALQRPVCPALHFLYAPQNSRENRMALACSGVWELGWVLIPAPAILSVHAPSDSTDQTKMTKNQMQAQRIFQATRNPRHQEHPNPAMPAACGIRAAQRRQISATGHVCVCVCARACVCVCVWIIGPLFTGSRKLA